MSSNVDDFSELWIWDCSMHIFEEIFVLRDGFTWDRYAG